MLDANLKNTLRSYLQNLKTPVELSLAVDQSEKRSGTEGISARYCDLI